MTGVQTQVYALAILTDPDADPAVFCALSAQTLID